MKKCHILLIFLSICLLLQAQPDPPVSATAYPNLVLSGGTTKLNAVSPGNFIGWYDVETGGTSLGSINASGQDFTVNPGTTTTYYAESVDKVLASKTIRMYNTDYDNDGLHGIMFSVNALNDAVIIDGFNFDGNATSNYDISLYYKQYDYDGYEQNESAWTLYQTWDDFPVEVVLSGNTNYLDIDDFTIPAGTVYSFYIVTSSIHSMLIGRVDGYWRNFQDDNIKIRTGRGTGNEPFGWLFNNYYSLNGGVKYYKPSETTSTTRTAVTVDVTSLSGSGTSEDPYQINNLNDLEKLSGLVNQWEKYFIQTANIDASTTSVWNNGAGFSPIGESTTNFTGNYNGQNYAISNLTINRPSQEYVGLFGIAENATIENLDVTSATVTGSNKTGVLVGKTDDGSTIADIAVSGTVVGGDNSYIGGLIGWVNDDVEIERCSADVIVSGGISVGGFAGAIIDNNGVNLPVVQLCRATGNVTCTARNGGGFVGWNTGIINRSYASGDVQGTHSDQSRLGGFVGANAYYLSSTGSINNCYAHGDVSTTGSNTSTSPGIGGFVGRFYSGGIITNSYATGIVSEGTNYGGFCGNFPAGTSTENFWDTQSSLNNDADPSGATGKTTAEMKTISTFTTAGWDCIGETSNGTNDYWYIYSDYNNEYPYLTWIDFAILSNDVQNISSTSAQPTGTVLGDGGLSITRGICWNTTGNPDISDNTTDEGSGPGNFNSTLSGLTPLTTYYIRAYATNSLNQTIYGDVKSFITPEVPEVSTQAITDITERTAVGHGTIISLGNPATVSSYGVCWSTSENPTISDAFSDEGSTTTTGSFSTNITSLEPETNYYVRAYATNSGGTVYGEQFTFTTPDFFEGDGTQAIPYQIATLSDLHSLSQEPTYWDKYFIQMADIDAAATSTWDEGNGFYPIGNSTTPFTGNYDGDSHTIDNLFINRASDTYVGFFGYVTSGSISDLSILTCNISGYENVGGLVGYKYGTATIENCHVSTSAENAISGSRGVGGVIGLEGNTTSGDISNCSFTGNVHCTSISSNSKAGGFIGSKEGTSTISNCFASGGEVTGTGRNHGGFVGWHDNGIIETSYATMQVTNTTATNGRIGGFAGCVAYLSFRSGVINNSYATGDVSANFTTNQYNYGIGGFVGAYYADGDNYVFNCYSTGSVSADVATENVGGFSGEGKTGGIMPYDNFWDTETSGWTTSGLDENGDTGASSEQMKTESTFTNNNWDFVGESENGNDDIWTINASYNDGYPYLNDNPSSDAATPITLVSFTADVKDASVELNWQTASETNNAAFLLYRNNEIIARLDGAGTTSETNNYVYTDASVVPGVAYTYVLVDVNYANNINKHADKAITVNIPVNDIEQNCVLMNNYPNPFNPSTTISYQLAEESNIVLSIYDMNGKEVTRLVNRSMSAGYHEIIWDASEHCSGVYFYKLGVGNQIESKKMILMK